MANNSSSLLRASYCPWYKSNNLLILCNNYSLIYGALLVPLRVLAYFLQASGLFIARVLRNVFFQHDLFFSAQFFFDVTFFQLDLLSRCLINYGLKIVDHIGGQFREGIPVFSNRSKFTN